MYLFTNYWVASYARSARYIVGLVVIDPQISRQRRTYLTASQLALTSTANSGSRKARQAQAKQLAKALEPHRPLFIEEPILVEHPEALKQLANMTSIPIALGERLYHRWDVKKFLEDGLIDILQPDIAHAGRSTSFHPSGHS